MLQPNALPAAEARTNAAVERTEHEILSRAKAEFFLADSRSVEDPHRAACATAELPGSVASPRR